MKIAVIDNYDSFVYNLIRYLEESGAEIFVMRNNQIQSEVLENCDAILLSPGPGIPDDAGEMKNIIEKYKNSKSILGVCLGHQALAEVFGNKLELCETPLHGESSLIKIIGQDSIFEGIPASIQVGRYHSWKVNRTIKFPLIPTALSEQNEIMAFEHESLPIFGIQFHPESILTPQGRKMIENWLKIIVQSKNQNN